MRALINAEVEFVLIGGWSAIIDGSRYMTDDLDICYARKAENLSPLASTLAFFHPRLRGLPEGRAQAWERNGFYADDRLGGYRPVG